MVFTATVSRKLAPSAFGLLALAGLVLRFTNYFSQLGITSAIVQRQQLDDLTVRTAFTIACSVSTFFYLATFLVAPVAASLLERPDLVGVVRALGLTLIISGLGATATGLLQRGMRFRLLAIIEVCSYAIAYPGVGLWLVSLGVGVPSLIVAALVQASLVTIASYAMVRHSVRPSMDRAHMRSLTSFGGRVSVIGFTEFLASNVDTLAVGRFYGTADLGQYSRATFLAALPAERTATGLSRVLLPAVSRFQTDRERVAKTYVSGLVVFNSLLIPLCAALAVVSRDLVAVLLGPQWTTAGKLLPLVALAVALDYTILVPAIICEAQGRLGTKLWIQLSHLAAILVAVAIAVRLDLGLFGLAWCWALAQALRNVLYLVTSVRALAPDPRLLARAYGEALAAASLVSGGMAVLQHLIHTAAVLRLAAVSVTGVGLYLGYVASLPSLLIRQEIRDRQLLRRLREHSGAD